LISILKAEHFRKIDADVHFRVLGLCRLVDGSIIIPDHYGAAPSNGITLPKPSPPHHPKV